MSIERETDVLLLLNISYISTFILPKILSIRSLEHAVNIRLHAKKYIGTQ